MRLFYRQFFPLALVFGWLALPITAAAQDSFNLSSMTDNGTGDYTITIAVTMKNANYCFTVGVEQNTGQNTNNFGSKHGTTQTTTALTMSGGHEGGTLDFAEYCVSIQGDLA